MIHQALYRAAPKRAAFCCEGLEQKEKADKSTRVFIACRVENVRLIDNVLLGD